MSSRPSYQASSKVDAAKLMAAFAERIRPGVITIVHRDRDFMSDDEVDRLRAKFNLEQTPNMRLFVTRGSDIESYFVRPEHIASITGKSLLDARSLIEDVLHQDTIGFSASFIRKRDEIKRDLYKSDPEKCPKIDDLIAGNQIPIEKAVGKILLNKLKQRLQKEGFNGGILIQPSKALVDTEIAEIFC